MTHIPDEAVQEKRHLIQSYDWFFKSTGVDAIDDILSSIADAAESYHNTSQWKDEGHIDRIQKYADVAAANLSAPCAVEVESRAKRVASIHRKKDDGTVFGSFHKETAEVIEELLSCVVAKPVDALTPAEAVFGLLAWLTSRKETVVLGASHGAAIGAELAAEFCKVNNLGDCRDSFPKNLKHPTTTASQPADVAAVRRQAFEEGFENGVEQSLDALNSYDDITRNEAEHSIRKLKPDYRALSAEPAQVDKWKPIETAPKNNRILVLQSCNGLIAVAHWDDWNEHWSTGGGCMNFIAGVTHWMPLPAAPTTEAGK